MFQKNLYKTSKLTFNIYFENRAVYEIMWKNIVEPCRPLVTTLFLRIESWIPKSTNTHTPNK